MKEENKRYVRSNYGSMFSKKYVDWGKYKTREAVREILDNDDEKI